jgi:murein DD-endopeptidase MepM/ murein hydrolase activator NlpD
MDKNQTVILIAGAALLTYLVAKFGINTKMTNEQWQQTKKRGLVQLPLRGKIRITSPFGNRVNPVTGQPQFHNGVDLVLDDAQTDGAPIYAPFDGVILRNWFDTIGGYSLQIGNGVVTFGFAHMKTQSSLTVGTMVKRGQIVGNIGNSGRSTSPHLHFTVRLNKTAVNPIAEIPAFQKLA